MLRSWSDSSFRIAPAGSQAATLLWTADRILPYEQASPPERSSAEGAPPATLVRRVWKPSNDGKVGISGIVGARLKDVYQGTEPQGKRGDFAVFSSLAERPAGRGRNGPSCYRR